MAEELSKEEQMKAITDAHYKFLKNMHDYGYPVARRPMFVMGDAMKEAFEKWLNTNKKEVIEAIAKAAVSITINQ